MLEPRVQHHPLKRNSFFGQQLHHILGDYGCIVLERTGSDTHSFLLVNDILYQHRRNVFVVKQLIHNDISSSKVRQVVECRDSVDACVLVHVKTNMRNIYACLFYRTQTLRQARILHSLSGTGQCVAIYRGTSAVCGIVFRIHRPCTGVTLFPQEFAFASRFARHARHARRSMFTLIEKVILITAHKSAHTRLELVPLMVSSHKPSPVGLIISFFLSLPFQPRPIQPMLLSFGAIVAVACALVGALAGPLAAGDSFGEELLLRAHADGTVAAYFQWHVRAPAVDGRWRRD